jgi:spore coat polysaccharide biosynthesis protein SpsF
VSGAPACSVRTVIISQARMGSTRLPGKVLHMAAGRPFLQHHLERLRQAQQAHDTWVATTTLPSDEPIVDLCRRLGVPCFRGSELDVLARYHGAAEAAQAQRIVRVTADCPLIDPQVVDAVITRMGRTDSEPPAYVSNTLTRSYPRGLDCEIFSRDCLDEAHRLAVAPEEREHVTPYIYRRPERFRLAQVVFLQDLSRYRWTVDTPEDEDLVRRLLEAALLLNPRFRLEELLCVLSAHPEWERINAHIEQKVS